MAVLNIPRLLFLLLLQFQTLLVRASPHPLLSKPSPALIANLTRTNHPPPGLGTFPPGIPEDPFPYVIPDTDLAITFSPLGQPPDRNETTVKRLLMSCIQDSLSKRITAKIPVRGLQAQEGGFLLSVGHSTGAYDLTWGMWTIVLTAINGYVRAYPGYDFSFVVRRFRGDEDLEGYVIGAGFAKTR
ncbi:MAG: hypothetical protein Q9186_001003 [Xanthomendoza sp. 1 TL-2023]